MNTFSVVEMAKNRRRAIDHPVEQNNFCYQSGYEAKMNLEHTSAYLPALQQPFGCVADITASFYGFELPSGARAYYRVRDSEGNLYEANRLMMGMALSAEIQHIYTCLLAGHPDYVEPQHAIMPSASLVHVWIDNIRYCGSRNLVYNARRRLEERMRRARVTMTIEPVSDKYEFIGLEWNHTNKTVRVSEKTRAKLPGSIPDSISAGELEQLIGRLIWVAGAYQEPLARHWFCLKWSRRKFNALNNKTLLSSDIVQIPPSARTSLARWLELAHHDHHKVVFAKPHGRHATLFTDATLQNWGAVLVLDDNQIFASGGKFSNTDSLSTKANISVMETRAVHRALVSFADKLEKLSSIDILVDNTSTQYGIHKGLPHADALVDDITKTWEILIKNNVKANIGRIATARNPADEVSRLKAVDIKKVKEAMREDYAFHKRRGFVV